MVQLRHAITEYAKQFIDETNDWYSWRTINEDILPEGVVLPEGNQYSKNIALKSQLNQKWQASSSDEERADLTKYYISDWGGIKTNGSASLAEYLTKSAEELILKGKKGIASWSKAIVLHDQNKYAIFDARVAISLNCIRLFGTYRINCYSQF